MTARLIVIEGSDGAGKETQTDLLFKHLESQGKKVARVSFPRYNQTLGGSLLYEVLKSERSSKYGFSKVDPRIASKLYTMDREESLPYLRSLLESNEIVISDRYVESNLLHQGGKFPLDADKIAFANWLYSVEYDDVKLPKPDEIVYLSLPFWLSRKRAELRAQNGGPKLDAVESDIEYIKQGHMAGLFYAKHFKWLVIEGVEGGQEVSAKEIHRKMYLWLGYGPANYIDSIP
jgi:dTMP kinase